MDRNPTGASLLTARVPRKSRSPSAETVPPATSIPSEVATARSVTPAHATSACSSMSPEQSSEPSPPVAGCKPATASAAVPGRVLTPTVAGLVLAGYAVALLAAASRTTIRRDVT